MVNVIPFKAAHARAMRVQPRQAGWRDAAPDAHFVALESHPSLTIMDGERPVMSGGVIQVWPGRKVVWALMAEDIGHRMTACTRITRRFLDSQFTGRLELDVERDHAEGHRFARLLGFEKETDRLVSFYTGGLDGTMYVKVS
jgi:hypothetical protein